MAFRIDWSRTSLDDLKSIIRYISHDSPARAEAFALHIISEVQRLASSPYIGRAVPEFRSPQIREIIVRP